MSASRTQLADLDLWVRDQSIMSEQAAKKRRLSSYQQIDAAEAQFLDEQDIDIISDEPTSAQKPNAVKDSCDDERERISISAMSKAAGQNVAPFLAKHIPGQYAPGRALQGPNRNRQHKDPNTQYCYRHRPDNKCRRQADDAAMSQLQDNLGQLSQEDQQAITHIWSIFSAAPAKQRNLILQGILTQCCFPQLSFLSSSVRDLIRIDFLSTLPPEISFRILCFLDTKSLCNAAQVSHNWRVLADDDVVWHRMCEQHIHRKCNKCGWGLPLLEKNRLRASKRQIQLRATGRGLNEWSPNITPNPERRAAAASVVSSSGDAGGDSYAGSVPEDSYFPRKTRPWKDVYKDRFKVGTNWKYGRCDVKIFKGHTNGVMCLQFDDQNLATGSYDGTLKIWDIGTGKELRTLRGHHSVIRCLQFDDTKLISGSLDHKIKIWNWRTGECISTLTGHTDGVIGLTFNSSILVSGSADHTIRVWNFDDKSTCVLRGHSDWVNSVKIDSASRTVFSASDDSTVKIWDLDTKTCLKTLEGHVGQVQQVVLLARDYEPEDEDDAASEHEAGSCSSSVAGGVASGTAQSEPSSPIEVVEAFGRAFASHTQRPKPPQYILTSALDSTIRLWDTYTGKSIRTYFGHVEGVWALAADTLRVVSGAQDRTVKVWDGKGRCEFTFTGHAGPVTCIGLSDSRMCSGGEDSEVRMYSF